MKNLILTLLCVLVASPVMAGVSLYPGGVSNTERGSALADMGQMDPTQYHNYFDDYNYYDSAEWTVTSTGTPTTAIQDEDGGVLKLTTDNATNDTDYLQFGSETVKMETGQPAWFSTRMQASHADNASIVMGMQVTDTTPLDVSDGIFFKIDGDSVLDFYVENDGTASTATNLTTVSNSTYVDISWYYNGVDEIAYFVDGQQRGNVSVDNLPTNSDDELTVSFGLKNNSADVTSMSVDYIFMSKER